VLVLYPDAAPHEWLGSKAEADALKKQGKKKFAKVSALV
jgi:hypothetical protein